MLSRNLKSIILSAKSTALICLVHHYNVRDPPSFREMLHSQHSIYYLGQNASIASPGSSSSVQVSRELALGSNLSFLVLIKPTTTSLATRDNNFPPPLGSPPIYSQYLRLQGNTSTHIPSEPPPLGNQQKSPGVPHVPMAPGGPGAIGILERNITTAVPSLQCPRHTPR